MRVATGAINHESSTFTPVRTTWESYRDERFGYLQGEQLFDKFTDSATCIGGFIKAAEIHGFELIPTIFANAHPSAPTPRSIFDAILDDMQKRLAAADGVDAVLLELHGAMVVEGIDDGEGHILAALRRQLGPDVPILAQLDIHSNMSQAMIGEADVLIGRKTYPEIDLVERSLQCAEVLMRMVQEGARPTMALHQIPMIWGMNQVTDHPPMSEAVQKLRELEERPEVLCASIATCFPLADIPDMGASVYVATDGDEPLAQRLADELGEWIFARRSDWHAPTYNTRECLQQAEKEEEYPVIFADRNDNTGGGAPGDSTGMLRTFVEENLQDACLLNVVDTESVAACQAAGVGATVDLQVGGKSSPLQGEPLQMRAKVVALSDGGFVYDGPRNAGLSGSMGPSAHIVQDGIHVLLVSIREQPFGPAFARTMGLEPQQMRYIGIKSTVHFRAGFESWAGAIHSVTEPGANDPPGGGAAFKRLGRKIYPYDDI
jgi:microcystin degradation protein MlrC